MLPLRSLYLLALPLPAVAISISSLATRDASTECCDNTVNPLDPLGINILQLLGLEADDVIGVIGFNCVSLSLETVLDGECTLSNLYTCQETVQVPLLGDDISLGCQPDLLTALPLL